MLLRFVTIAAASAIGLVMCAADHARAAIYNINAQDVVGTPITLAEGMYQIGWIGQADGGAYNAANTSCGAANCTTGWTNSFSLRDPFFDEAFLPGGATTVDVFSVGALGSTFGSALGSLNEYQTSSINAYSIDINSGVVDPPQCCIGIPQQPFDINIPGQWAGTYHLVVTDTNGSYSNNFGGVSLSITAVPEPATWVLMLLGFGGLGIALRSRRQSSAAHAVGSKVTGVFRI